MKEKVILMFLVVVVLFTSGCYTTGLSVREKGAFNYSNLIYGLYDTGNNQVKDTKPVKRPIKLAVAQVGESSPQKLFIEKLESEKHLVAKVVSIPVGGDISNFYNNNREKESSEELSKKMDKIRRLAKDLGSDYIFLFGGSADYGTTQNWLMLFDLTIIGGFMLPSNKISIEAKASGALIDVESGKVIFLVNSEAKAEEYVPTYTSMGREDIVLGKTRDKLVSDLADEFIQELAGL